MMTKSTLLKISLAAAIATPAAGYGLAKSFASDEPEVTRFDQAPRGERRFQVGDVEPGFERPEREARVQGQPERVRRDRGARPERVRGEWSVAAGTERDVRGRRGNRGEHNRGEREARVIERMTADLQLTDSQAVRVRAVLDRARESRQSLRELPREERREAGRAMRAEVNAELDEILTPAQRETRDAQRAERRAAWAERRAAGPGGMRARNAEAERYVGGIDSRGI